VVSIYGISLSVDYMSFRLVSSSLGLIVPAPRKASCVDAVILLDEVGQSDFHGDPSAVLLDVLDLEQNWSSMIIISMFQLIYLKFYLSVLPIHSTLYPRHYSIDVK